MKLLLETKKKPIYINLIYIMISIFSFYPFGKVYILEASDEGIQSNSVELKIKRIGHNLCWKTLKNFSFSDGVSYVKLLKTKYYIFGFCMNFFSTWNKHLEGGIKKHTPINTLSRVLSSLQYFIW